MFALYAYDKDRLRPVADTGPGGLLFLGSGSYSSTMTERKPISITYRRQSFSGQWWIEDNVLHVTSSIGSKTGPAVSLSRHVSLPSELAAGMLWDLARENDPKRPFFFWR